MENGNMADENERVVRKVYASVHEDGERALVWVGEGRDPGDGVLVSGRPDTVLAVLRALRRPECQLAVEHEMLARGASRGPFDSDPLPQIDQPPEVTVEEPVALPPPPRASKRPRAMPEAPAQPPETPEAPATAEPGGEPPPNTPST